MIIILVASKVLYVNDINVYVTVYFTANFCKEYLLYFNNVCGINLRKGGAEEGCFKLSFKR